jgi:fatty-acyl-CoA synthase
MIGQPLDVAEVHGASLEVRRIAVGEMLREAATDSPDRIALIEGAGERSARRSWTYGDLLRDAEACARVLLSRYRPGDRIAIWSSNLPEYQIVQYGVALAGMTLVTINPAFRRNEAGFVLRQSGAVACFAADSFRGRSLAAVASDIAADLLSLADVHPIERLDELVNHADPAVGLMEVDPDTPAQILYTSGTTGEPKGAMLSHLGMVNNIPWAVRRIACGVEDDVVFMAVLPMFHLAGCVVAALGSVALRGALLTVDGFDPARVLQLIEEQRVTTMNLVPTMMIALLNEPTLLERDLSSLGSIMLGGAAVAPELVARVESELGIPVVNGYGMTEAACVTMTSHLDDDHERRHSSGLPFPGVEVRAVDLRTGELCPPGVPGEAQTKGVHVMSGYFEDAEATAAAFTQDGWYRAGDVCTIDTRGYLRVVGRSKEMIIRGGENVFPREIEDHLLAHHAVAEVAVIGLPDDYYGEIPAAFVRLQSGSQASATDLREFLYERLTGVKVPSSWYFVDELPHTPSGKIRKFVLREQWDQGTYEPPEP